VCVCIFSILLFNFSTIFSCKYLDFSGNLARNTNTISWQFVTILHFSELVANSNEFELSSYSPVMGMFMAKVWGGLSCWLFSKSQCEFVSFTLYKFILNRHIII